MSSVTRSALFGWKKAVLFSGAAISNRSYRSFSDCPVKILLARGGKTNDIITLDPSLTTQYDTTEEASSIFTGSYTLFAIWETKLVFIEVQDICWLRSETTTL